MYFALLLRKTCCLQLYNYVERNSKLGNCNLTIFGEISYLTSGHISRFPFFSCPVHNFQLIVSKGILIFALQTR